MQTDFLPQAQSQQSPQTQHQATTHVQQVHLLVMICEELLRGSKQTYHVSGLALRAVSLLLLLNDHWWCCHHDWLLLHVHFRS